MLKIDSWIEIEKIEKKIWPVHSYGSSYVQKKIWEKKININYLTTKDNHNANVGVFQDEMSTFMFSIYLFIFPWYLPISFFSKKF